MKSNVQINAGICGFLTTVKAESQDNQQVLLEIESSCDNIKKLAALIHEQNPVDAYLEISPAGDSIILGTAMKNQIGCCIGCVVPVGIFKAMQVAAGLALPKDIVVSMK